MDEKQSIVRNEFTYTPAPPFVSNRREVISGLVSYVLAYLYICMWTCPMSVESLGGSYLFWQNFYWLLFCGGFTAWELWYSRQQTCTKEHWLWLSGLWICAVSFCVLTVEGMKNFPLQFGRIWEGRVFLFTHLYAIYWVLCRSGRLLDGESGALVVFDGINGLITNPFQHFFLRIRSLLYAVTHRTKRKEKKINYVRLGYSLLAVVVGIGFFVLAASLLSQADAQFHSLLGGLLVQLPNWNMDTLTEYFSRFLFSVPVGAYLNGLVTGTLRQPKEMMEKERNSIRTSLNSLHKIPVLVWSVLLGAFVLLYLLFFWIQGQYLFGALLGGAPAEGYTVAEYARQGFFELCKIMALNFALLWVIAFSSETPLRQRTSLKLLSTALMGESVLFAITAFSKLALYIHRFNFTPLRFQSAWGILVMLVGCLCVLFQVWTGRKTARFWVLFTGISLALTVLY